MTVKDLLNTLEPNQLIKITNHESLMLNRKDRLASTLIGNYVIDSIQLEYIKDFPDEQPTTVILVTLKTEYIIEH